MFILIAELFVKIYNKRKNNVNCVQNLNNLHVVYIAC